jgi:hypothetical protein
MDKIGDILKVAYPTIVGYVVIPFTRFFSFEGVSSSVFSRMMK